MEGAGGSVVIGNDDFRRGFTRCQGNDVTLKLHRTALTQGQRLIANGRGVWDERDAWSEHRPSARQENAFIKKYGFVEYGKWHLGVDDSEPSDTKEHYRFPYGDFDMVHRCGLLAAESRAGQYKYAAIEAAAARLVGLLDKLTPAPAERGR